MLAAALLQLLSGHPWNAAVEWACRERSLARCGRSPASLPLSALARSLLKHRGLSVFPVIKNAWLCLIKGHLDK